MLGAWNISMGGTAMTVAKTWVGNICFNSQAIRLTNTSRPTRATSGRCWRNSRRRTKSESTEYYLQMKIGSQVCKIPYRIVDNAPRLHPYHNPYRAIHHVFPIGATPRRQSAEWPPGSYRFVESSKRDARHTIQTPRSVCAVVYRSRYNQRQRAARMVRLVQNATSISSYKTFHIENNSGAKTRHVVYTVAA